MVEIGFELLPGDDEPRRIVDLTPDEDDMVVYACRWFAQRFKDIADAIETENE